MIELGCSEVVTMIKASTHDYSRHMALVHKIQSLMADEREFVINLVNHTQNKASHGLDAYGRCTSHTAVWFGHL